MNVENNTAFVSQSVLLPNENGEDTVYVSVKASYAIGDNALSLLDVQPPIHRTDHYRDKPDNSSLVYPSDVHLSKLASDIILTGAACAQGNEPVSQLSISIVVGQFKRMLSIYGNRYWCEGEPSKPQPFTEMPVIYENAFGGVHGNHSSPENPLGKGYIDQASVTSLKEEIEGFPLPNIENPEALIRSIQDQPIPAGTGAIVPYSSMRCQYAGTYDTHWQRKRAPYAPLDYDSRFQNTAHPDFVFPGFLNGGEQVTIDNMHPDGRLQFSLPKIQLEGLVHLTRDKLQFLLFKLDTLYLEPNERIATLVWHAAYTIDDHRSIISKISLNEVSPTLAVVA